MDTSGIIWWAGLIAVSAVICFVSKRIKREIDENGIETEGVISRIVDEGGTDGIDYTYYVRYRTEDGEEIEGILLNPDSGLEEGGRVRLRYHPKHRENAKLI